ncbi:MAG: DUF1641 domain-containing protein [Actinomycetia bacterium]|nr:DUF1641 domain-containing protein [Actinomycetes bacterium]
MSTDMQHAAPAPAQSQANGELASRLDELSAKVDLIADELILQRQAREKWSELGESLTPVTAQAMELASNELTALNEEVTLDDLTHFLRTLAVSLPQLTSTLEQLDTVAGLTQELTKLSGPAMASLTEALQSADEKGYFAFARQGRFVAERVMTEFSEDDVHALGDNIVTILTAVKEMTQPEVMQLVQRTAVTVQDSDEVPTEPPSLFTLAKSLRDPTTRAGLARVLAMLHTVGETSSPAAPVTQSQTQTKTTAQQRR